MIEFTRGDMFKIQVDARVNTVNCKGVMGAGVALAFKTRYPEMYKDYKKACHVGKVRPGNMYIWRNLLGDWVINFPTKRDWREPSRYDDILAGLDDLHRYLQEVGPISVALPALGCGHGGLDWSVVSAMIKEKLADLDSKVYVFEPADSLKAGQVTKEEQPTNEQMRQLQEAGFRIASLPQLDPASNEAIPNTILLKGDEELLNHRWIALLPSKEPGERERIALEAVARQMALEAKSTVVAVVHATRSTEKIVEIFQRYKVPVILILPFGPLTRKTVASISAQHGAPFAVVSISAPSEAWSRPIHARSMALLRLSASSVLVSDPEPEWLKGGALHSWAQRRMFYLRYEAHSEDKRNLLHREGAHPISRRSDTGEPNLTPLFAIEENAKLHEEPIGKVENSVKESYTLPLTAESSSQLGDIATLLDKCFCLGATVTFTVPCEPSADSLRTYLKKITESSKAKCEDDPNL